MEDKLSFGDLLNSYLGKKGWTQSELATKLRIHRSTVSRWIGNQAKPEADIILRIADVLKLEDIDTKTLIGSAGYEWSRHYSQSKRLDENKKGHQGETVAFPQETPSGVSEVKPTITSDLVTTRQPSLNFSFNETYQKEILAGLRAIDTAQQHFQTEIEKIQQPIQKFANSQTMLGIIDLGEAKARFALLPIDYVPDYADPPRNSRMPFHPNQLFVGRNTELMQLAAWLHNSILQSSVSRFTAVINGIAGIGKTQLATAFVYHYGHFFLGGVFWLDCSDPNSISDEIAKCYDLIPELPNNININTSRKAELVKSAWQQEVPRLLVFDNCEDPEIINLWRPTYGGCCALITSQRSEWPSFLGIQKLQLREMTPNEGIDLLCKFPQVRGTRSYTESEKNVLKEIAEELGYMPLALHLAGSFVENFRNVEPVSKYLEQLRKHYVFGHISMQIDRDEISPTSHDSNIFRTFSLSYNRLNRFKEVDRLARRLLLQASYYAPGIAIPIDIFLTPYHVVLSQEHLVAPGGQLIGKLLAYIYRILGEKEPKSSALADMAWTRLSNLGLVEYEPHKSVRIHRLIGHYVRQRASKFAIRRVRVLVRSQLFSQAYRTDYGRVPASIQKWQPHIDNTLAFSSNIDLVVLHHARGMIYANSGELLKSKDCFECALETCRSIYKKDNDITIAMLNNIASVLHEMGNLAESEVYYLEAFSLWVKKPTRRFHRSTAIYLINIGTLLGEMGRLDTALIMLEESFQICQKILGNHHSYTARSANNLGRLLYRMGELAKAESYIRKAIDIQKEYLGEIHPDIALSLNDLGLLLEGMGNLEESRYYLEKSLSINRQLLGERHLSTIRGYINLGMLLNKMGELDTALVYFEKVYTIRNEELGEMHNDTLVSLFRVCRLLNEMGENNKALSYYSHGFGIMERVLVFCEEKVGSEHKDLLRLRSYIENDLPKWVWAK